MSKKEIRIECMGEIFEELGIIATKEQIEKRLKFFRLDVYFGKFKWYRKLRKGTWYKHQFTKDAEELTFPQGDTWWARYGKINRYSNVIATEVF
jgi:hypothetical protein